MTYTLEQTIAFVNQTVASMEHSFEWSKNIEDYTDGRKCRWALKCIDKEEERCFGALLYVNCYLHGIEDKDYEDLNDRLHREADEIRDRVQNYYNC